MAESVITLITTSLGWGGTEGHVTDLAVGFVKRGIHPIVIVDKEPLDRLELLKHAGVQVEILAKSEVKTSDEYKALLTKLLLSINAAILHVNVWERYELILETAKDAGIPTIITLHQTVNYIFRHKFLISSQPIQLLKKLKVYKNSNPAIINISDLSNTNFRKQYPFINKTRRIYCGVYIPPAPNDVFRSGNSPTVLWIGSLIERKRPIDALNAWKRIVDEFPDAKLIMVGDGPERNKVKEAVKNLELNNVLLCGNVEDLHPMLLAADIMLNTSTAEGIPKNLIYALTFGIPIMSTNVGAIAEAVIDGKNGYLVEVGDDNRLEHCLRQLIGNAELRRKMGEYGRELGEKLFDYDDMIDNVLNAYRELCGIAIHLDKIPNDYTAKLVLS